MISLILTTIIIMSVTTTAISVYAFEENEILAENLSTIATEQKILIAVDINDDFVEDEVIVVLNNLTSRELNDFSVSDFPELALKSVKNLTKETDDMLKEQRASEAVATLNSGIESTSDESAFYIDEDTYHQFLLLKLNNSGKENVINSIELLEQRDNVILAMPNYIDVIEPMEESVATVDEVMASARATTNTPNDYTGEIGQWGIDRIDLPEAWNIITGSNSIIIGVMDSGIRGDHEDLSANMAASSYHKNFTDDGTSALSDQGGHGTQIAGVIAAVGNNGVGTVGACWNIKLASLKVFKYNSTTDKYETSADKFVEAITHAKTKGITILNYSAGGSGKNTNILNALLSYTGLFICSAGNEGIEVTSTNHYPASYNTDNMIAVAKGSDSTNDALASDSNYSTTYVDLSAPGVNILTTDSDSKESYIITGGSSIAAPYVTGVAALLKSKYPEMNTQAMKYYILGGVDKKDTLSDKVSTGGRLNAYNTLNNVTTFTVKYNANGGTGTMADTKVIYYNSTPLRANTFTKENYTFKGWYAKRASDSKWCYYNGTTYKWYLEGSQPSGYTKYLYVDKRSIIDTTSVNGDTVTMYAQWTPNYTVSFNGNNASGGTMSDMNVIFGVPYNLTTNNFYRSNCDMLHWYAKKGTLMYYTGSTGAGWYTHGSQPSGYTRKEFTDEMYIIESSLEDISGGDEITMNAYWKPEYDDLGDFNMDGSVNVKDATSIQDNLSQTENLTAYQIIVGDVNFSGSLTVKDATMIQKYVAKQIDEFGS